LAPGLTSFSRSVVSDQYSASYDSVNVRFGSRLCENADTETNCATIESGKSRGRIIVAAMANFMIQYFVSISKK